MSAAGIVKTAFNAGLLTKAPVCFRLTLGSTDPIVGTCINILQQRRHQHASVQTRQEPQPYSYVNKESPYIYEEKTYTQADMDDAFRNKRMGKIVTTLDPEDMPHFKKHTDADVAIQEADIPPAATHTLPHRIWSDEELYSVQITHKKPEGLVDKAAYNTIQFIRKSFDYVSGFNTRERNEDAWIKRIVFLETVAGVPGMVAAMTRHLHSLRRMRRDYGWIHTLLEEAENERMHLMTALQLKQPSVLTKIGVVGAQGFFVTAFSISYLISPRFCHRFVGYLEEEAVKTYTKCLQDIENGPLKIWQTKPAPDVAKRYWALGPDAIMKDVILAMRADEAQHRMVNHTFASMKKYQWNPYKPGE